METVQLLLGHAELDHVRPYLEVSWKKLEEPADHVANTVQHIDKPAPGYPARYPYNTTSAVAAEPDGTFRFTIGYAHRDNKHIQKNGSWWGFTTILLRPGDTEGAVEWTHAGAYASSGEYIFRAATWRDDEEGMVNDDADEVDHARRADEAEIEGRPNFNGEGKDD